MRTQPTGTHGREHMVSTILHVLIEAFFISAGIFALYVIGSSLRELINYLQGK